MHHGTDVIIVHLLSLMSTLGEEVCIDVPAMGTSCRNFDVRLMSADEHVCIAVENTTIIVNNNYCGMNKAYKYYFICPLKHLICLLIFQLLLQLDTK